MKLLLIVHSGDDREVVPTLLDRHQVHGWTELPRAHGAGASGRREGTRAWPGDSALYFTAVDDAKASELTDALAEAARALPEGERLHATVLPVERFF
jgi:nucleoid-associated protein YgaU